MILLFVISGIEGGGAEKQMQNLLRHFATHANEVHLAITDRIDTNKVVLPNNVTIHHFKQGFKPASLFIIFQLIGMIKTIRPDKIVSFTWSMNTIAILASMLTGKLKKTIVSERIIPSFHVKFFKFAYIRSMLIRLLYPFAGKIIAVSRQVKADLHDNFAVPESRIDIIYNGIDIKICRLKTALFTASFPKPYLIYVGNLYPYKNHLFLLNAFKLIIEQIKDIRLVFIGEGPERNAIENNIKRLHLENTVILAGKSDNPFPYIAGSEAFIIASKFEGFSNAILEAIACEVPVVAVKNLTAADEVIEDNRSGMLIFEEDPSLFAEKVIKLLQDHHLRNTLVKNALAVLEHDFTLDNMLAKYEQIIQSV